MEYDTYKQLVEATRPTSTDNSLDEDNTFSPSTPAPKGIPSVFSLFSPVVTPFSASRNRKTLSPSATVDPNNLPEYADSSRQASEEPNKDSIIVTSLRTTRARGQLYNCLLEFDKKALSFQKMVESGSKFKTIAVRHMHTKALVAHIVNLIKEQWNICYKHAKLGASQEFGNALNGSTFVVYTNYSNWFRLYARPPIPSNLLEIYTYRPTNSAGYNSTPMLNPIILKTLRDRILTKKMQSDWIEDSSILSGNEFSY
ncbi:hypothetical protein EG327_003899 [Venturia inaequalis]|uniref:Uncharacterized protein n=1 Tax=Venturia inaequalis TaxID=5025 RepID=A0A8H3YIC5_VENIN|nr:hypothetical protein EG327_003899 [Venturia inaequalis]